MPHPPIDWEELRVAHNEIHGTDFTTVKQMLWVFYVVENMGSRDIERRLGPSSCAILTKLRQLGIDIKPRGGSRWNR